ncbi:hypothetical protein [Actinomadura flavalba]|uniref:hypothetical protein n=1 Tax=Actinomadura flavalba TaxID=1120938 RepID=UPI00037CD737|nr:hypothetical protein [Actinomadura flavalba]
MIPGVDVVAVKRAVIAVAAALADGGPLDGVQVAYAWPGRRMDRECVHGGAMDWETSPASLANGEDVALVMDVHIVIVRPGGTVEETDARAAELGAALAAAVHADPSLGGQPGVLDAAVVGGDLDHGADDDSATSVLTQRIRVGCYQQ